jgi:hypothetical protein
LLLLKLRSHDAVRRALHVWLSITFAGRRSSMSSHVPERLRKIGDPLASFFRHAQSLAPLLDSGRARRLRPMA